MKDASPEMMSIFCAAVERSSTEERAAFVNEACGQNAELRARIDALLSAHDQVGGFLPEKAEGVRATIEQALSEQPGMVIGPYKLLQQIGEGGMGVVWMAEQTQPVQRKVALKVIKPGMDSRQVIARFEAERQALAMMDHVNIARVFDGGTTGSNSKSESRNPKQIRSTKSEIPNQPEGQVSDIGASDLGFVSDFDIRDPDFRSGRPYFVMELVHGVPITKYCDDNHLTPRERLELFVPVCHAIQHAHQKGIIHRDIKPSNVMVTLYDGKPVPKVIDFGVAKATEQKLTERTLFTQYGTMVGTLEYMSPEQAEMSALGVDTRSDIYSLGVLLYELLTGSTPLTHKRMKEAAYAEILRMIKEEEPPKPSTRLSTTEELPSIAANRGVEPKKLSGLVRGELDWIVMKALEKDRNRRYETAKDFVADVQRYLADEAVQACPPSAGYRLRKFARRNKAALVMTSVIGVAFLLTVASLGWTVRDRAARQSRVGAQVDLILGDVDRLEREQKWPDALAAARRAEAVLAGGDADAATALRVRDRLKDHEFIDRLEQTRMLHARWVGRAFDYAAADRAYAEAFRDYGVDVDQLAIETSVQRLKTRPQFAIPFAAALDDWVGVRRDMNTDAADWTRLVAVARGIDPEPVRDRLRATWGRPIAECEDELLRLAESIDLRAQHPVTIERLARTLQRANQFDSAIRLLRDAQRTYPGDFWLNYGLGSALYHQKDHEGAVRFCTAAVSIRPNAVAVLNDLGNALNDQKKPDEAIAAYRKAIEINPRFERAYANLGIVLRAQGKAVEAVAAFRKAVELDPNDAGPLNNLGGLLCDDLKEYDKAIECFRKAIELDPTLAVARQGLGIALGYKCWNLVSSPDPKARDPKRAIEAAREAVELDPSSTLAWQWLGWVRYRAGDWPGSIEALEKSCNLQKGGTGDLGQWIVLALAHARLAAQEGLPEKARENHGKEARRWYEAADKQINRRWGDRPRHVSGQGIWDFREEARQVIGPGAVVEAWLPLNDRAWVLATDADPSRRDPPQAVALAEKAVAAAPREANCWNTLGAARYRAGDFKGAVEALRKYRELREGDAEWSNPFFLAMAHWQLGEKVKAREWYDKGVEWMERKNVKSGVTPRLRAEAAGLLAIEKQGSGDRKPKSEKGPS